MKFILIFITTFLLRATVFGQVLDPSADPQAQVKRALSDALLVTEYDCRGEEMPSDYSDPELSFYIASLSTWVMTPEIGIEIRNESTEVIVARESTYRSVRQVSFILDPSGVRIDEIHEVSEKTIVEERNIGAISAPDYQTVLELIESGKITCLAK